MPKPPPIDHLPNDDEPTEVESRPRGAEPDEMELVEAEPVALEVGVVTDKNFEKGPKNEDAVLVDERSDTYGVLDGMGGHAAGEVASSRASEFIREELVKMPKGIQHDGQQVADYLRSAVIQANGQLMQMAEADPKLKGMGTTCSIMHVLKGPDGKPRELITAQVGDSRVYRLRKGKLERITADHSLIQQAIDTGHLVDGRPLPPDADQIGDPEVDAKMTKAQRAFIAEHRNKIVAALGYQDTRVDVVRTPIEESDEFIAISDGIGDCLTDREIEAIARQYSGDPVRISEALVAASQERVKAKDRAFYAGQPSDALTARGKDDDRSAVAIRITPEAVAEVTPDQPRIAQETLDAWRQLDDGGLEKTIGEYQRILRARREGKPVIASQISRADGMREAYFDATDRERPAILVRDSAYKRAALEAIDGVYIERYVPTETLAKWEDETTTSLEKTAQKYREILDVYDHGFAPPISAISRVHGLREAYQRAQTDAEGRDALRRDRLYKEMATRALDRILARRAGGAFADDYDLLDQPAKAQRLLSMYEDRLQLLEDRYKAREQEARAVTRFHWPEDASDAQIQACLAAEREHVRRRIRQAKRSLQASGRKPGRAAGTNPPQARA